jgi:hypothetical protein
MVGRVDYEAPPGALRPGGAPRFDELVRPALVNGGRLPPSVAPPAPPPAAARDGASRVRAAAREAPLRLGVSEDGLISVSGADLAAAGWAIDERDPGRLALTSGGRPHAIEVEGGDDGRLDPADRISFVGRAMTGEYTRENAYYLHADGPEAARMGRRDGSPRPAAAPEVTSHTAVRHWEEDSYYAMSLSGGEGVERWLWGAPLSAPANREVPIEAPHGLAEGTAELRVALQGHSDDPGRPADHHVRLRLGDRTVADLRFDGFDRETVRADVPAALLAAEPLHLGIETVRDTGAAVDSVALDRVELRYPAALYAEADRLAFTAEGDGRRHYALRGFGSSNVVVLDVTDPARPVRMTGVAVGEEADGSLSAHFEDDAPRGTRYLAYAAAGRLAATPRVAPPPVEAPEGGADLIVVVHPSLEAAVRPLADRRRSEGLRTALVRVDSIYESYSHGVFDPRAIRAFLQDAYHNWARPAPTFVLLVGEANLDYRGGYGPGPPNLVPSLQVDLDAGGQATSDLPFAALVGDDPLPDVLLGRITAARADELAAVVDKLLAYDPGAPAAWRRRLLLVADDEGAGANEGLLEALAARLPGAEALRFFAAHFPRERDLTAELRSAVEEGALAVAFAGHGNVDYWSGWPGGGRILQNRDVAGLRNAPRLPLLTTATCMNGWFSHPLKPVSLAELWLRQPGGGGVAAWSPTGLAPLAPQARLLEAFYDGLGARPGSPVGALAVAAAVSARAADPGTEDAIRMFALLGDPTSVLVGATTEPPSATPTAGAGTGAGRGTGGGAGALYLPRAAR